jgi:hypothetical protein
MASESDLATWVQAISTAVLGGVVAYIAWRDHRISSETLKLGLFERRSKAYQALLDALGPVIRSGKAEDGDLRAFMLAEAQARFLFSEAVEKYLREVYLTLVRMQENGTIMPTVTDPEERKKRARAHTEFMTEVGNVYTELPKRLEPFLRFTSPRRGV